MGAEQATSPMCLLRLTAKIPQVILVTHKRSEAGHYIELEAA